MTYNPPTFGGRAPNAGPDGEPRGEEKGMAVDWNDESVKSPDDFHASLWAGRPGATADFVLGYAQALYDSGAIDMEGLGRYAAAASSGELSHNLDFEDGEDSLRERIDMAAFDMAAHDVEVSDMLSALAGAVGHGGLAGFKEEWMRKGGE